MSQVEFLLALAKQSNSLQNLFLNSENIEQLQVAPCLADEMQNFS